MYNKTIIIFRRFIPPSISSSLQSVKLDKSPDPAAGLSFLSLTRFIKCVRRAHKLCTYPYAYTSAQFPSPNCVNLLFFPFQIRYTFHNKTWYEHFFSAGLVWCRFISAFQLKLWKSRELKLKPKPGYQSLYATSLQFVNARAKARQMKAVGVSEEERLKRLRDFPLKI